METRNIIIGTALGILLAIYLGVGSDVGQQPAAVETTLVRDVDRPQSNNSVATIEHNLIESIVPVLERRPLKELLRESIAQARPFVASQSQISTFESLFKQTLLCKEIDAELIQCWRETGWRVNLDDSNANVVIISEQPGQRSGRGIYAVRLSSTSPVSLQAPHRFYDEGSGLLVRKLFEEHDVRAAAWNTIHRREIDLAHCNEHYINAFTRAVIRANGKSITAQIHGYNGSKQSGPAVDSLAIVSDTTRYPGRLAMQSATQLKESFGGTAILLFPVETDVLGGTKNRQAQVARNSGSNEFLHIELNAPFRQQLLENANSRGVLLRSLMPANDLSEQNPAR